ncbi:hypothetical protein J6590_099727 [Homalodisca vitripennis]|nr:hypothetical protein J6590_099727 [Homalodisca vitripennis]
MSTSPVVQPEHFGSKTQVRRDEKSRGTRTMYIVRYTFGNVKDCFSTLIFMSQECPDYMQRCRRITGIEAEAPALPYVVVGLGGSRITSIEAEAPALPYVVVGLGRSCRDNNILDCEEAQALPYVVVGLSGSCRDNNIQDYVQDCRRISGNEAEAPALPYVVVGLSGSCRDNNIQDYVQSCRRISGTEAEAPTLSYVVVGLGGSCRDNNIQDYVQSCRRISGTEAEAPTLPYVVVGLGGSCRGNNIQDYLLAVDLLTLGLSRGLFTSIIPETNTIFHCVDVAWIEKLRGHNDSLFSPLQDCR